MSKSILYTFVDIQKQLSQYKFDKGEITGNLLLNRSNLEEIKELSKSEIVENFLIINGTTISLEHAISFLGAEVSITAYLRNIPDGFFYDSEADFIAKNKYYQPKEVFYIKSIDYYSDADVNQNLLNKVNDVHRFIRLMEEIADVVLEEADNTRVLILFQKRKILMPIIYNQNHLRAIPFLEDLEKQLCSSHDKEERISIFKSEIVTFLLEIPEGERFGKLITMLDIIYDNYLKSHLLYLEKFSYHDLKSEIDADKLEFTKKIYSTVNDIQTKLIAVPAAFLLILSQFDFTGESDTKNLLIVIASILFSGLLEILLRNQFGVLKYIEVEIKDLRNELSNKDTKLDLSEFVTSFADLQPLMDKQRCYLWIFRSIVWLVSLVSIFMFFCFKK
ncbi:MAG: hypothetical protein J0I32_07955 [Sphingobacteriales bacterium]|nr:hypothetical protein [Sphingobacteriales bacterium]OJW03534.1 MAG: hypothetical protein BGO52_15180 [Sphingobacteriales bacterium 44-61]